MGYQRLPLAVQDSIRFPPRSIQHRQKLEEVKLQFRLRDRLCLDPRREFFHQQVELQLILPSSRLLVGLQAK